MESKKDQEGDEWNGISNQIQKGYDKSAQKIIKIINAQGDLVQKINNEQE